MRQTPTKETVYHEPMRHVVWGTAGHIDHGKTTLVKALTGTDCDRLPEERERGITIDLGFAQLSEDEIQLHFVDVPGHERLVHTMIAGASGIDLALLVVAADEGVMPQTREHLDIIRLMGVPGGAVALTKIDLMDDDLIELVTEEIRELLAPALGIRLPPQRHPQLGRDAERTGLVFPGASRPHRRWCTPEGERAERSRARSPRAGLLALAG